MPETVEQIPDDVRELVDQIGESMFGRHERGWISWPLITVDGPHAERIIARAIMADRSRRPSSEVGKVDTLSHAGEGERERALEEAAKAGWNACRKSIYAVCEDIQERAADPAKLSLAKTPEQKDHERGYYFGESQAAKSIARGFNAMEAEDDDNFTASVRALSTPAPQAEPKPGKQQHEAWRARAKAFGATVNETPFGTVTTFQHMDELIAFARPVDKGEGTAE